MHQLNSIRTEFHLRIKRMTPMVHRTLKFNLSFELVNNRTGLLLATKFAIYLIDLRTFFDFITAINYFHSNCASRENEKWRNENGKSDGKHTLTHTQTNSFEILLIWPCASPAYKHYFHKILNANETVERCAIPLYTFLLSTDSPPPSIRGRLCVSFASHANESTRMMESDRDGIRMSPW